MKLKSIEFQFENCEYVTINGAYVWNFVVDDINKSFERVAMNAVEPLEICNKFLIEFSDDANKISNVVNSSDFENLYDTVFERITKYNDITGIDFVLVDNEGKEQEYFYSLNWEDADHNGEENLYQKSYVSDNGFLYLVVGKDLKIEDFPDYDSINVKDYADDIKRILNDFRWDGSDEEDVGTDC